VDLFDILSILFVLAFLAIMFYFMKRKSKAYEGWTQFAQQNGLKLEQPPAVFGGLIKLPPTVEGTYEDRRLMMNSYEVHSGSASNSSSTTYHRLVIELRIPYTGKLTIHKEGLLAKIGKALGKEDIQLHDLQFDPEYVVRCSDKELPNQVLGVLTRNRLLEFKKWDFVWEGDTAIAERVDVEGDPDRLTKLVQILAEVADQLERMAHRQASTDD